MELGRELLVFVSEICPSAVLPRFHRCVRAETGDVRDKLGLALVCCEDLPGFASADQMRATSPSANCGASMEGRVKAATLGPASTPG